MSNLQQEFNTFSSDDVWSDFRYMLSHFGVIDIGKIVELNDNIATVDTYTVKGSRVMKVQAEVLMLGNLSGYLGTIDVGQPCLIVYPRSPIVSAQDEVLDTKLGEYSEGAAKCIPLCSYASQLVTISTASSTVSVSSADYAVAFSEKALDIMSDNYVKHIDTDTGESEESWLQGKLRKNSEGLEVLQGASFDTDNNIVNWLSRIKQGVDGSLIVDTAGSVDDSNESFGQCTVQFGADGSIGVDVGKDKDGKVASKISISKDGNIKLAVFDGDEEKSSITLDKAGTLDITTTDQYSIKGVGVAIDGTDGKVSIKNGQASMYDILKGMLQILNTSLATQGSPAAHTVVPNQFQQQATALDNLME